MKNMHRSVCLRPSKSTCKLRGKQHVAKVNSFSFFDFPFTSIYLCGGISRTCLHKQLQSVKCSQGWNAQPPRLLRWNSRASAFFLCWIMVSASFPPKAMTDDWSSSPGPRPPAHWIPSVCYCPFASISPAPPTPTSIPARVVLKPASVSISSSVGFVGGGCIAYTPRVCEKESGSFLFPLQQIHHQYLFTECL